MTPEVPSCIHGEPLHLNDCQRCADLIAEQQRRDQWLDGLVRMTEFFQKHPDFIPPETSGGAYIYARRHDVLTADQRTAVFDLVEATGPVTRRASIFSNESKVCTTAFLPHEFCLSVDNGAIGNPVVRPTDQWEWDESIFGEEG